MLISTRILQIVSWILVLTCCNTKNDRTAGDVTVFKNVNVVGMTDEVILSDYSVLVRNGIIEKIESSSILEIPENALLIDGKGDYLMPGLADMHVHIADTNDLLLLLSNGITTVRNMSGGPKHLEWRELVHSGQLIGPRIYTSSPVVDGGIERYDGAVKPPLGPDEWEQYRTVSSVDEIESVLNDYSSKGYDFIKIYDNLNLEEYKEIIRVADEINVKISGHVPFGVGVDAVLSSNQHCIEHLRGYIFELIRDYPDVEIRFDKHSRLLAWSWIEADSVKFQNLARQTAQSGIWNCPTLSRYYKNMSPTDVHLARLNRPEMRYFPKERIEKWKKRNQRPGYEKYTEEDYLQTNKGFENKKKFVGFLHRNGAKILLGTDDWFVGFSVHVELEELVNAGLSPYDAIMSGTVNAAEVVGASQMFGSISVGKSADLLLIEGNPLDDVSNIRNQVGVMVRGNWYTDKMLKELIEPIAVGNVN